MIGELEEEIGNDPELTKARAILHRMDSSGDADRVPAWVDLAGVPKAE